MMRMHGPMMAGVHDPDPDHAFIRGMIPHHQGAIDMAQIELRYGKDAKTRALASIILRDQQAQIAEMARWLADHPG